MKRDYYEILGVDPRVGPDDLKRAYRKLAHQFHPDKNPDDPAAEARFKEASEAYAVLSDPEKRGTYDRFGHAGVTGGQGGDPFAGFDPFTSFGDLFNEFFGGDREHLAEIRQLEDRFGGTPMARRRLHWEIGREEAPGRRP